MANASRWPRAPPIVAQCSGSSTREGRTGRSGTRAVTVRVAVQIRMPVVPADAAVERGDIDRELAEFLSLATRCATAACAVTLSLAVAWDNIVAVIQGGNATIYVSDMGRAVDFYHDTLGLGLVFRAGDHWAEIDAGGGLHLGLHPASARGPAPGTLGGITVGLSVDEPIGKVVAALQQRGVTFDGPIVDDVEGGLALAFFADPDGNPLYLAPLPRRGLTGRHSEAAHGGQHRGVLAERRADHPRSFSAPPACDAAVGAHAGPFLRLGHVVRSGSVERRGERVLGGAEPVEGCQHLGRHPGSGPAQGAASR